jgi:hypothetical protein
MAYFVKANHRPESHKIWAIICNFFGFACPACIRAQPWKPPEFHMTAVTGIQNFCL